MNNIDTLNLVFTILSIMIPVFATIYTAYSRIRNENRETHKPYLVLDEILKLEQIDEYKYYLNLNNNNNDKNLIYVSLVVKNIGYGVASNIKFYNLSDGSEIHGNQEKDSNKIQKLFTTLDIACNSEKRLQACLSSNVSNSETRILCMYKDLNGNIYDFIMSINMKENSNYDFFAYQPSSHSYRKWINQNKKSYYKIYKDYGNL